MCGRSACANLGRKLRKRVYGPSVEVFLNVYDLFDLGKVNDRTIHLGFGAFHSAVEVFGIEFAFGYPAGLYIVNFSDLTTFQGVYTISPRMSSIGRFREAISMGVAAMVVEDLKDVIRELQYASLLILGSNCPTEPNFFLKNITFPQTTATRSPTSCV